MSYIQFQQQCQNCKEHWNAAFGIVGTTQIAAPPDKCPHCGSDKLEKFADGWTWNSPVPQPESAPETKDFDPESIRRYMDRRGYLFLYPTGDWVWSKDYDALLALYREAQDKIRSLEVENVEVD